MNAEPQANFTPRCQAIINESKKLCSKLRHDSVEPIHLFSCILSNQFSVIPDLLATYSISIDEAITCVSANLQKVKPIDRNSTFNIHFSKDCKEVIFSAIEISEQLLHPYVGVEHLLISILEQKDALTSAVLESLEINYKEFHVLLHNQLFLASGVDNIGWSPSQSSANQESSASSKHKSQSSYPVIEKYCKNLNKIAEQDGFAKLVSKDVELKVLCEILCRKNKNNPILLGEPGVGKTAIIEGLASSIVNQTCPSILLNKSIFSLDLGLLVAGTKYRGQFEERLKKLLNEFKNFKNSILFIDEIHTIIGAGGAEGSMDACNILKPALARGEVSCIGATTLSEYKKTIRKDGALSRRFHPIKVNEPSTEETLKILKGISPFYEKYHKVKYRDEALTYCVNLAEKYVNEGNFPDKAIDILDHAGSKCKIKNFNIPEAIKDLEKTISERIDSTSYLHNGSMTGDLEELFEKYESMLKEWDKDYEKNLPIISKKEILDIVSEKCNVSIKDMDESTVEKAKSLNRFLSRKLINQKDAIKSLSNCLKRNLCGLKEPNKPLGSFLFLGSTGVGKTYLSKLLSSHLFQSKDSFISIDMSEYSEKNSISKFIGSAPGYVGYEEGGGLVEKLRANPHAVVLFDEIEKAHPDVLNILLQILEEGSLTDNTGYSADFSKSIVIATSNIGSEKIIENKSLGFMSSPESAESLVIKDLEKSMRPELINRFDEIIVFNQLKDDDFKSIINIEISKIKSMLKHSKIQINVDEKALEYLYNLNFDKKYGARFISRTLKNELQNPLSDFILKNYQQKKINITTTKNGRGIKLY